MVGAEEGVVDKGEVVEVSVGDKEEEQAKEIEEEVKVKVEVAVPQEAGTVAEARIMVGVKAKTPTPGTRPKDMLTSLHLSPAGAIGPMGSLHISAWSRPHAHGRSSGCLNPIIEGLTSSTKVTKILKKFKICCIQLIFQK